jgi:flap endonuclease-1
MGVKGLTKLIKKEAPKAVKKYHFNKLYGRFVVADTSHVIHQYVSGITRNTKITTKKGKFTAHIAGIVNKTLFILRRHIFPIYVYDGKSHVLKSETLTKRKESKEKAKHESAKFSFEQWMEKETQEALDFMGIPWYKAKEEADQQCAAFSKSYVDKHGKKVNSKVWGVLSDDGDMLTFGAKRLIREFNSKSDECTVIDLKTLKKELNLTQELFVELCILMGCDYCPTFPKVGPTTALKIIRAYQAGTGPSVEEYAKNSKNASKEWINDWIKRFRESKKIFMESKTESSEHVPATWQHPNYEGLKAFLKKAGFTDPDRKVSELEHIYQSWRKEAKLKLDAKKKKNKKENVQWADHCGAKLVQIREIETRKEMDRKMRKSKRVVDKDDDDYYLHKKQNSHANKKKKKGPRKGTMRKSSPKKQRV